MPPKAKFTREQIVEKAFAIVRSEGLNALTARYLGAKLGSSARPIFTVFDSMEDVTCEVVKSAKNLYAEYISKGLAAVPAFKGVGTQYIKFAIDEPQLFRLLFMSVHENAVTANVLPTVDDNYSAILSSVTEGYGLDESIAHNIYMHLWVYTHGIATMCATKTCHYTEAEISRMMTEVFLSLLKFVREDRRSEDRN